jgi:hypothetical protein
MPDDHVTRLSGHFHHAQRDTANHSALRHESPHPIDLIIA